MSNQDGSFPWFAQGQGLLPKGLLPTAGYQVCDVLTTYSERIVTMQNVSCGTSCSKVFLDFLLT